MTVELERDFRQAIKLIKVALKNNKPGEINAAIHVGQKKIVQVKAGVTKQLEADRRRAA